MRPPTTILTLWFSLWSAPATAWIASSYTYPTPRQRAATSLSVHSIDGECDETGVTDSRRRLLSTAGPALLAYSALGPPLAVPARANPNPLADVGLREFLVKDGPEFLRLGLPTSLPTATDPESLGDVARSAQEAVELVRLRLEQVGFSGRGPVWNQCLKEVKKAKTLLDSPDMLKPVVFKGIKGGSPPTAADKKRQVELITQAKEVLTDLETGVRKQDIESTRRLQDEAGRLVGEARELSLPKGVLPYAIPSEFENLPVLKGRATLECEIARGKDKKFIFEDGSKKGTVVLKMVVDGYRAPLTAGNFVDLVSRKFYDGLPISNTDDITVYSGNPADGSGGFVDPKTKETRVLPLEIFYKKDSAPTYGYTSDEDKRSTESFVMPFQAYGALGMVHDPEDVNTASSQFWFLKWDQALIAPSRNTLDGSTACFGYVVENQDILSQVGKGDTIVNIRVLKGINNLYVP